VALKMRGWLAVPSILRYRTVVKRRLSDRHHKVWWQEAMLLVGFGGGGRTAVKVNPVNLRNQALA